MAAEANQAIASRKRQQIERANRSMFAWVAGASVIVALAIVAGQFMVQQAIFNERVLHEKRVTDRTLTDNLASVDGLKESVNVLLADDNLAAARAKSDDSNFQVILDALPPAYDALNLGTSLQTVLLGGNVQRIDRLTVEGESGAQIVEDASVIVEEGPREIPFRFTVNGNYDQMKELFRTLERSIRPIQVRNIGIEGSDNNLVVSVEAITYYQQAKVMQLQEKTITP